MRENLRAITGIPVPNLKLLHFHGIGRWKEKIEDFPTIFF